MFDLNEMSRWDAGLARLETACPKQLRDLFREIMAVPAPVHIDRQGSERSEEREVAA